MTSQIALRPAQPDAGGMPRHDRDRRHRRLALRRRRPGDAAGTPSSSARPTTPRWASACRPRWGPAWPTRARASWSIVGDGAFQMTGMELSTIAQHGLNPIVVLLNNHGYTTERFLLEGSFNDIRDWSYHRIPEVLGGGTGFEVRTVGELDAALESALANTAGLQPAQRPPRPLRPQPGPRAAGQPPVQDRHIRLMNDPGRLNGLRVCLRGLVGWVERSDAHRSSTPIWWASRLRRSTHPTTDRPPCGGP